MGKQAVLNVLKPRLLGEMAYLGKRVSDGQHSGALGDHVIEIRARRARASELCRPIPRRIRELLGSPRQANFAVAAARDATSKRFERLAGRSCARAYRTARLLLACGGWG